MTVLRDGKWLSIDSVNLVVGDIVKLQSGDKVPADVRLLQCRDLQVDESALTGESVPVIKKEGKLDPETILADRRNMAYAGTLVTYGQAQAVIIATGDNTETGRISEMITQATDLSTPLTKKITSFDCDSRAGSADICRGDLARRRRYLHVHGRGRAGRRRDSRGPARRRDHHACHRRQPDGQT